MFFLYLGEGSLNITQTSVKKKFKVAFNSCIWVILKFPILYLNDLISSKPGTCTAMAEGCDEGWMSLPPSQFYFTLKSRRLTSHVLTHATCSTVTLF